MVPRGWPTVARGGQGWPGVARGCPGVGLGVANMYRTFSEDLVFSLILNSGISDIQSDSMRSQGFPGGSQGVPRGCRHDQQANWQQLFVGFAGLPLFYFQAAVKNSIFTLSLTLWCFLFPMRQLTCEVSRAHRGAQIKD